MKKESKLLLERALDSLLLSIEHFNRPWDRGRQEATLILLDRAFELFLKAIILQKGGKIREKRAKETIGYEKCVRKCLSDVKIKCLDEEQALTLQIINSLRDAAQHHLLDTSEQQLYMYAQAGVTLFDTLLKKVFGKNLSSYLPDRVLPISTTVPTELDILLNAEFKEIKQLVVPGSRKRIEARAKLRSLAIIESSLAGERSQPSKSDLNKIIKKIQEGKSWGTIFPGVATLKLETSGTGPSISIRLTKQDGEAIHLVKEGTPGATTVAIKRVNELSFYSLGLRDLAEKIGLTYPKTLAVIRHLKIQGNNEYFKILKIGAAEYKRYSMKALNRLKESLPNLDIDEIWQKYGIRKKKLV